MRANSSIGTRLKECREALDLTQTAMAQAVHSKPRTWQEWEADNRTPGGRALGELADRGFNINWILTGEGQMRIQPNQAPAHADMVRDVLGGDEAAGARRMAHIDALAKRSGDLQREIDAMLDKPELELSRTQRELIKAEMHDALLARSRPESTPGEFVHIPLYDVEASAGHGSAVTDEQISGRYAFRRDFIRAQGWREEDLVLIWGRGDSMPGVIEDGQLVLVNLALNTVQAEGIYVLRMDEHLVIKTVQRDHKGNVYIRSTNPRYREIMVPADELGELNVVGRAVWTDSLL